MVESKKRMTEGKPIYGSMTEENYQFLAKNPSRKEEVFNRLFDEHKKQLYFYIRRMVLVHEDADDVLQNTFVKIWKGLESFRGESKINTWMHRIAYNETITFLNKKKKVSFVSNEVARDVIDLLKSDVDYSGTEIQMKLQSALATLPDKQKAVFILKYYDAKKYDEISEITGTSVGALKASYHHAVKKIEGFLKEE